MVLLVKSVLCFWMDKGDAWYWHRVFQVWIPWNGGWSV